MRYDNIIRFLGVTFVLGALIGLVAGLVFGGGDSVAGPTDTTIAAAGSSSTTVADHEPMTAEKAKSIGANELGQVMVLEYHKIGGEESTWTRTSDNFRKDIELLKTEGYYPINLRDFAVGDIQVPAGKSPVVITFDDSSPGQYRILEDGTIDPNSAVGIMQQAVTSGNWASRATFFCLLDVTPHDNEVFGQPELKEEKIGNLISWGYEVGSHTVTHLNLKKASTQEIKKQLTLSKTTLEEMAGGDYQVTSISIPFGEYPSTDSLLTGGEYEGASYAYRAAVEVAGGPECSPFSKEFRPLHIKRIQVTGSALKDLVDYFKSHPEMRFVSDGDPAAVSAPKTVADKLGEIAPDLGRPVLRY